MTTGTPATADGRTLPGAHRLRSDDGRDSLAQIISTGHASFVCCGERDDSPRLVQQDAYRFCYKSAVDVNVMINHDQRDISHIAAVYSWALATVIPAVGDAA